MTENRILMIGANGQIGSLLTKALRKQYGQANVVACDLSFPSEGTNHLPFEILDPIDAAKLSFLVERYRIGQIYHMAAIPSMQGEINPVETWQINMSGLFNVLEIACEKKLSKVFFPSSVAVFGSNTPRINTPQDTIRTPETVYGMSKAAGENWCSYYFNRYGLDIRSIRYPGVVGYESKFGSVLSDFATDIFQKAIKGEPCHCYLKENTRIPMLYVEDAVQATMDLMQAPIGKIAIRSSYNISGMSITPEELAKEVRNYYPDFAITYKPDFRQKIVETCPESLDDTVAREDWGWKPQYDLSKMTVEMIQRLKEARLNKRE